MFVGFGFREDTCARGVWASGGGGAVFKRSGYGEALWFCRSRPFSLPTLYAMLDEKNVECVVTVLCFPPSLFTSTHV